MNIPVLGIFFPIEEAIVITCIVIVIYLIVFRFEFKQLSMISKKIGDEETELNKEIKELQQELSLFSDGIKNKDTGSSSVKADDTGSKETESKDTESDASESDDKKTDKSKSKDIRSDESKSGDTKTKGTQSDDTKVKDSKSDDTKSEDKESEEERLKSMLD